MTACDDPSVRERLRCAALALGSATGDRRASLFNVAISFLWPLDAADFPGGLRETFETIEKTLTNDDKSSFEDSIAALSDDEVEKVVGEILFLARSYKGVASQ